MSYRNTNSFDGKECKFDNTKFKYEFKQYCEKSGYTQKQVLDDLSEQCNAPIETIRNWLKNTKPVDGIISKDGKLNENAIVVKLAKFFEINVKNLLAFTETKGEKKMNIVKEHERIIERDKYNTSQIQALKHLNDIVMEYMILKCHTMDNYTDESNFIDQYNYSLFVDDKFNTFHKITNEEIKNYHIEKTQEEKNNDKENEIKRLTEEIENVKNKLFVSIGKKRLENIDNWMIEKEKIEERERALKAKYKTNDENYAYFLEDFNEDNTAYAYVLFEIEKASTMLRKEFIYKLEEGLRYLYEIYDNCFIKKEDTSATIFASNEEEKKELEELGIIKITDYVKFLFTKEFSLYC